MFILIIQSMIISIFWKVLTCWDHENLRRFCFGSLFEFSSNLLPSLTGRTFCSLKEPTMDFRRVKDYFSWLYYQYQIISCCAVLEPWEQSMFNTILLTIFAMVVYTAYVFIPIHIRLAWEFFSKMCGYHSTISNWSCLHSVNWHCTCICCLQRIDLGEHCVFFHYLIWKALSCLCTLISCLNFEIDVSLGSFVHATLCIRP